MISVSFPISKKYLLDKMEKELKLVAVNIIISFGVVKGINLQHTTLI